MLVVSCLIGVGGMLAIVAFMLEDTRVGAWGMGVCFLSGLVIGIGGPLWLFYRALSSDDPLYRDTPCVGPRPVNRIEITSDGFPAGIACVQVEWDGDKAEQRFVNRSEYPVRVCLGRAGDCAGGHKAPVHLTQGVTIQPRQSVTIDFPIYEPSVGHFSRNYPITLSTSGELDVQRPDLVIQNFLPD